jgi:hypothetical protein
MRLALAFALAALLLPAPAGAQCADYEDVRRALTQLGERLIATANHPAGGIEFWANPETRSFTIVGRPVQHPQAGCLIMDGTDLRLVRGGLTPGGKEALGL